VATVAQIFAVIAGLGSHMSPPSRWRASSPFARVVLRHGDVENGGRKGRDIDVRP
jgi:hypothetical protein